MNKEPKITIYTQVYNTKKYLRQCFDSVVNQSVQIHQYIIVDNGSTDGCSEIINEYAEKYDFIEVVKHKTNQRGFWHKLIAEKATGDYIMTLDSDDWLELDCLEKTVNQLEKDEMDRRKGIEREVPSVEFEYNNMEPIEREEESKEFDYSELADSEQEKVNEAASEFEYNNMEEKAEEELKEFDYSELEVPEKDPANVEFDKFEESTPIAEKKEALNSATDLITTIYRDIVTSVKEVNTLEYAGKIPLPNGKYLNNEDIMKATNNYFSRIKGRTLKVESTNKEFVVNKSAVRKLRKALKHSAMSILIGKGKIGEPDLKRVYGVSGLDTYDLGLKKTDLPSGYYSHVDFYLDLLKQVFVEKKETWLDRFISKRQAKKSETVVTNNDFVEEQESVKTR